MLRGHARRSRCCTSPRIPQTLKQDVNVQVERNCGVNFCHEWVKWFSNTRKSSLLIRQRLPRLLCSWCQTIPLKGLAGVGRVDSVREEITKAQEAVLEEQAKLTKEEEALEDGLGRLNSLQKRRKVSQSSHHHQEFLQILQESWQN